MSGKQNTPSDMPLRGPDKLGIEDNSNIFFLISE